MKNRANLLEVINGLLIISLFISITVLSITLGVYIVVSAIILFKTKNSAKLDLLPSKQDLLIISIPILIVVVSLFWTEQITRGFDQIIKRIPLLLIPLCFRIQRPFLRKNFKTRALKFFVLCCSLFSLYGIISLFLYYPVDFKTQLTFIHLRYLFEHEIIYMHPVYCGLLCGLSSVFSFYYVLSSSLIKTPYKLIYFLSFALNLSILFFISARMSILSVIICVTVLIILFKKYKTLVLMLSIIVAVSIIQKSYSGFRFNEVIELISNGSFNSLSDKSTLKTRFEIYSCVLEVFKNSPIFGHGIGDIQEQLFLCTRNALGEFKYNSHNQYLEFMISSGIIGTITFLTFLVYLFLALFKKRSLLGCVVFIYFILSFFSENLFARTRGVFMFSYIIYLFYFFYETEQTNNDNN
jgi:O-antigen ligase